MRKVLIILAATAGLVVGSPGISSASDGDVRIDDGWLRGTVTTETRSFQGIPYAAPPVGALRWRAPRPVPPWQGVRDATEPGQECAQSNGPAVRGGEDCLYLNVMTPRTVTRPLPVMVFLHGGGLVTGSGSAYNPQRIVKQDAIVVTLNYRLGGLGFLQHPALDDPYAGNFGLADQQAALRWVRRNIAAFGGDQGNVTLWGQSGGGVTVCAQLASPSARGLFDKAIVQSAPCGNDTVDRQTATGRGLAFAASAGCAEAASAARCLRDAPLSRLVRQADRDETFKVHRHAVGKPWMPVAGTFTLPLQPLTALRLGTAADVPLMHGATKHEMRIHVAISYANKGVPLDYPRVVQELFGADAPRILAAYPASSYATPSLALATLLTDHGAMVGACTQLPALDASSRGAPVYAFEFAEQSPDLIGDMPLGAYHGYDVEYLLDFKPTQHTPAQRAFAERLIGYWTTFARTGNPWPGYQRGSGAVWSLSAGWTGLVDLAGEHRCDLWRTVR